MDHWLANDNNVEGGGDRFSRADDDNSTVPYDSESDTECLSVGDEEAHCYLDCIKMYDTEIKAYETLADLQGGYIPRFYGEVRLASWKDLDEKQTRRFGKYFEIRGFLMEFVDGYLLQVLLSTHQDSNGSTSWKRPFI